MSLVKDYKTFSQHRPWTARLLLTLLILLTLLGILRGLLPFAIKFGTESWLQKQGVDAHVQDMEISLLAGRFSLVDVSGKNKAGKGFNLGKFQVSWQWRPILDRKIIVNGIEINALKVDAEFFDNGEMIIAGLEIKPSGDVESIETVEASPAEPWDAIVNDVVLSDIEFCMQQYSENKIIELDYCGKLKKIAWEGELGFKPSMQSTPADVPLYMQGALNVRELVLHNNLIQLDLLRIGSIEVSRLDVVTLNDITVDSFELDQFSVLQRATKSSVDDAQLFAFDSLKIKPVKLAQLNDLNIGVVELLGSRAYLYINKQGEMDFKPWLPEKRTGQAAVTEPVTGKTETEVITQANPPVFNYSIDEIMLSSDQHLMFVDDSLKEKFSVDLHNIDVKYKNLNSRAPEQPGHVALNIGIDKHGSFILDADVTPLAERPSVKGTGKIAGFDLRMFSPLTKQYIGHDIKSGQLDVDLTLKVDKGIIDSNMGLALHQFVLKILSKEQAEALNSEFGFPLNSALSLLRDKDNTIRLDIPVTGDIDNPEFDPKDAIVTASSKAITAAVLHYYTPFGLVFAAGSLFDLATALSFTPVVFDAGTSGLIAVHKQELDKLAVLMTDRPGIHLTLCGISNLQDNNALFPQAVSKSSNSKEQQDAGPQVTSEMLTTLKKLAEDRSSAIKDYLVNIKKLEASRLIECAAEYESNQISGVEISI